MCGILVVANSEISLDRRKFSGINDLMKHRGPDSGNVFIEKQVGLGARRLRIHDITTGSDQPFSSRCGRYKIVFNGAIYNFRELRKDLENQGYEFFTNSDTEVLLYGYIAEGAKFVQRLEGMFAYAVYDLKEQEIVLFRDHVGIKPLYYYSDSRVFIAASEIKPILACPDVKAEVNKNVIPEFFAFQSVQPPDTLFKNIYVFPAGNYLRIQTKEVSKPVFIPYWDICLSASDSADPDLLEGLLIENLNHCWKNDRETCIQLSGGVDSSLLAAWSDSVLHVEPINTHSVIFDDNTRKYYKPRSEEVYIEQVAKHFGLVSHPYLFEASEIRSALPKAIWHHEAPLHGPSTSLYYLLAGKMKEYVAVTITGEGADDIFNGYYDGWDYNNGLDSHFKYFVPDRYIRDLFAIEEENDPLGKIMSTVGSLEEQEMSPIQKTSVLTIKRSLHALLARHDRMFMAHGIEGRPPFAAKNVIEARFSLPDDQIHRNGYGKYVIKNYAEKYLGRDFTYRPKIGFSCPYGDWLSDDEYWKGYWKYLDKELISEIMDIKIVNDILDLPDSAFKWTGDNLNFLMCLLNFQLWYALFFEADKRREMIAS